MRHEDIPEINNPKIRFPVLEGDKLMKEVLNGGYNVHPVPRLYAQPNNILLVKDRKLMSGSNKPKDNKVIPDPIDDRKFQE